MVFENIPAWEIILFVGLIVFFFINGIIILTIILWRFKWNFRVVILENIAGQGYIVSGRDRARLISFGDGGEEIFYLRKRKKYRIGYGKRIGNKYIAWAIGQDGYWYNISFGDLDKKLLELGVMPVDRDMRFATASVRKGIENRYNKKSFLEKWGTTIAIGMIIIAIVVQSAGYYINAKKQIELSQASAKSIEASKEVLETVKQVLSSLDTIKSGGSGYIEQPT
jgi:hypothetical protein